LGWDASAASDLFSIALRNLCITLIKAWKKGRAFFPVDKGAILHSSKTGPLQLPFTVHSPNAVQKTIMKIGARTVRAILMCVIASPALVSANAWADLNAEQAGDLFTRVTSGDKAALQTLVSEAQQGNQYAQLRLGLCFAIGEGVPRNYVQAAQWYLKAAQQGNAVAQNNLGFLYQFGQGVPRNHDQAVQWFRKAIQQGNPASQNALGVLYERGQGVPQDYSQAAQWFRKAAQQGQADGQNNLGLLYTRGLGVPQDYSQAVQWFRKAAQQRNANAQSNLGALYTTGRGVPQNLIVAYALFNLAAAQDVSGNGSASRNRASLAAHMPAQAIKTGQALSQEMGRPGNLLNALDQYLSTHPRPGTKSLET
jgi:TPR repeat protein